MIYFVLLVMLFAFAIMVKQLIDHEEAGTNVPIRRVDIPEENRERHRPMPHIDMETTRKLESEMTEQEKMNTYKTRGLFLRTLKNIGCQYEEEENGNRIFFAYQGETFFVEVSDDRFYVTVYDTHWGQVELYDIDEFTSFRKAINTANLNCALFPEDLLPILVPDWANLLRKQKSGSVKMACLPDWLKVKPFKQGKRLHCGRSDFPAMNIRAAVGVSGAVMLAVLTSCWLPSMLNCRVAPSVRTSMVTLAPITSGRFTSP